MTYEDPTQVVVIEEQRRRRGALPWIAGGAVIALLASGGTFALWRASADFTGGQVIAGDLDLAGCNSLVWYDISPDRTDRTVDLETALPGIDFTKSVLLATTDSNSIYGKALAVTSGLASSKYDTAYDTNLTSYRSDLTGTNTNVKAHLINSIATWKMVPGDTVLATCAGADGALMSLEGDNLVAALKLVDDSGAAITIAEPKCVGGTGWTSADPLLHDAGHCNGTYSEDLNGVVTGAETYVLRNMYPATATTLGFYGAPGTVAAGQAGGILNEISGTCQVSATNTTPVAWTDSSLPHYASNCPSAPGGFIPNLFELQTKTATPLGSAGAYTGFTAANSSSDLKDLRTFLPTAGTPGAAFSAGRASLGQDYVYPMFVIHFIDDGIEGPAFACYDDDDDSVLAAYTNEAACLADASSLAVGDPYWAQASGYTAVGTGDLGAANSRYLATEVLARIASGHLVLEQVRTGAGAFN